jgi:hypothetical protein
MKATLDDKQVLSLKVLRIFMRPGWGIYFRTRRYPSDLVMILGSPDRSELNVLWTRQLYIESHWINRESEMHQRLLWFYLERHFPQGNSCTPRPTFDIRGLSLYEDETFSDMTLMIHFFPQTTRIRGSKTGRHRAILSLFSASLNMCQTVWSAKSKASSRVQMLRSTLRDFQTNVKKNVAYQTFRNIYLFLPKYYRCAYHCDFAFICVTPQISDTR